ncbi:MAG: adenylate/guanylate cyclase domain-containing protein [Verrucomicrobiota bacterium]|jgi:class 3 adenylate cyclase
MSQPKKAGPRKAGSPLGHSPRAPRFDLSKVRHHLRTPINHILGYCEMLQEDEHTPEPFQADLQKIHAGGRQLLALMTEYFDEEIFGTQRLDLFQLCHALRTPVNHIIGYGEMLQEQAEDLGRKKLLADLAKITGAARTWLALMEEYLITPAAGAPAAAPAATGLLPPGLGFAPPGPMPPQAPVQAPGHLLVVDDDQVNRDMLARRLRRQGFGVALAASGLEGLQALRTDKFDLVLLDLVMPGLDGYQVLARLKSDAALAGVPVIMLSALDQDQSIARCIEAGAEDYIAKPFNPACLRARITACLEKQRLREQEALFLRRIQQEKQRADELLHIILPRDVVTELKATGAVKARRFENVGVLFCDIVGFAAYSDRRPPEDIVAQLQTLVEAFEGIADRHRLEKIKTIGDSFMAVAGLLRPVAEPALDCVRCGLEMIAATRAHAANWQVRVGVSVGPVVAGVVGRKKYQYDVWGDTVNTAARLEQAGDPGAVCVSAETWKLLADHCEGRSKGSVPIKGKGALEVFCVTSLRP